MKICRKCNIEQKESEFYKQARGKNGLSSWCKECMNAKARAWHKSHPERIKELARMNRKSDPERFRSTEKRYRVTNPEKIKSIDRQKRQSPAGRFSSYKGAAKNRSLEFALTFEQFMTFWKKECQYCGGIVKTIGIDRVDNSIGYLIENCVSCCELCNKMKRTLSVTEFKEQITRIYEKLNVQ